MIFLYHVLAAVTAALGLTAGFLVNKKWKIKSYVILFVLFLGIGMFIHFLFDGLVTNQDSFITYYINLEPWPESVTFDYLLSDIFTTTQYIR